MGHFLYIVFIFLFVKQCTADCPDIYCKNESLPTDLYSPRTQSEKCGRCYRDSSWICDPCAVLTEEEADEIDGMIGVVEAHTDKEHCPGKEFFYIAVGIVKDMYPIYMNDMKNARLFASYLRKTQWNLDNTVCGNDVIIFLSKKEKKVATSVGLAAFHVITDHCIEQIYEDAKDDIAAGRFTEGLKHIISEYKKALKDGKCDVPMETWKIGAIAGGSAGGLLLFLCCCYCCWCRDSDAKDKAHLYEPNSAEYLSELTGRREWRSNGTTPNEEKKGHVNDAFNNI